MGMKRDLAKARKDLVDAKAEQQLTKALDDVRAADKSVVAAATAYETKKKKKVIALLKRAKTQIDAFKHFLGDYSSDPNPLGTALSYYNAVKGTLTSVKGEVVKEN